MAKRTTTPRSEANDSSTRSAPRAKARRTPANTSPEADTIGAFPGIERSEDDGAVVQAIADPRAAANQSGPPSDEEIRERAYHRYLERGGHSGSDFDDWVEAERDLRSRR